MFLPSTITLQSGDSGDFVSELQRRLAAVECFHPDGINGFFDGPTYNGVFAFQTRHGIRADGVAGPETLRRLNGVISGDNSTTSDKKEEEQVAQPTGPSVFQQEMMAAAVTDPIHVPPPEAPRSAAPVMEPVAPPPPPTAPSPAELATTAQQTMLREQMQMQQPPTQPAQPSGPSAAEMLESALSRAAQNHAAQPARSTPPAAPQPPTPAPVLETKPAAPTPPAPQAQPVIQAATPPVQQAQPAATAPEQPRGLMGRAMQYANEMVQKLATHFEAKLPPSVLAEVQKIGHVMARSGMAEAPIPQEPTQARGAEIPSRGQEQGRQRT